MGAKVRVRRASLRVCIQGIIAFLVDCSPIPGPSLTIMQSQTPALPSSCGSWCFFSFQGIHGAWATVACSRFTMSVPEETAASRYVKLNKEHEQAIDEEIRPGELNQPVYVPEVLGPREFCLGWELGARNLANFFCFFFFFFSFELCIGATWFCVLLRVSMRQSNVESFFGSR